MSSLKDVDYPKIEIKMAEGGILENEGIYLWEEEQGHSWMP